MARKVIWAPRATALLEAAATHIELDSPSAARRLIADAINAADSLKDLSERGRAVPELKDDACRELIVGSYRLVYRVSADHVSIIAFIHGARDFRNWWRRSRSGRQSN